MDENSQIISFHSAPTRPPLNHKTDMLCPTNSLSSPDQCFNLFTALWTSLWETPVNNIPEEWQERSQPPLRDWEKKFGSREWSHGEERKRLLSKPTVQSSNTRKIPAFWSFDNCYSPGQGMRRTVFNNRNSYLHWWVITKMLFLFSSCEEKCIIQVYNHSQLFLGPMAFAC